MSLNKIIDVATVSQLLKKKIINKEGVRILDCTYAVGQKPDWKIFKEKYYGKFEEILSLPNASKATYLSGHIPEAVHINLDAAMYPSEYERFALYPPDIFEKYIQMVGINSGEHIILYSRGAIGGMMYSSKLAWLFKSYGHEKLSIINGGFDEWARNGFEISKEDVQLPVSGEIILHASDSHQSFVQIKVFKSGNWKAKDNVATNNITFEEMEAKKGDKQYMEQTSEVNFLDSRPRSQFDGTSETGLNPEYVTGSNIPGFKNMPAVELIDDKGLIKSPQEITQWLSSNGYQQGQPVVTLCNSGMQASMLAYVMDAILPHVSPRVYNGSMKEMELRDPRKICGGRVRVAITLNNLYEPPTREAGEFLYSYCLDHLK
ncbi:rhodanese-like protein [Dictyocaulus viviparus]|uniref:Rhodanese-like protein n=1 Tax=Dictyocaulus viviparus TaxID=29172 RepID=A0A0D8XS91_DICVI|nr:rhodanese-like protein [Dictyocaulus viviparus]